MAARQTFDEVFSFYCFLIASYETPFKAIFSIFPDCLPIPPLVSSFAIDALKQTGCGSLCLAVREFQKRSDVMIVRGA